MAKKEKVYGTHLKVSAKRAGHKIGGTVGIFVFLLVLALFMALPIYLAVVMSLKPVQELFVFPPKLYVIDPTLVQLQCHVPTLFRPVGAVLPLCIQQRLCYRIRYRVSGGVLRNGGVLSGKGTLPRCQGDQRDHRRCPAVSE